MSDWRIYRGAGLPHDEIQRLPAPPPWRDFSAGGQALYLVVRKTGTTVDPPIVHE